MVEDKLDRDRTFASIWGPILPRYEQDGKYYDGADYRVVEVNGKWFRPEVLEPKVEMQPPNEELPEVEIVKEDPVLVVEPDPPWDSEIESLLSLHTNALKIKVPYLDSEVLRRLHTAEVNGRERPAFVKTIQLELDVRTVPEPPRLD